MADFVATLEYKSTEDGGRRTAAQSGYRPHVKFSFSEMRTSGVQNFLGKEEVFPGERVEAEITILSPQFFENSLSEGMEFEFTEGDTVIGFGKIIKILNKNLCL